MKKAGANLAPSAEDYLRTSIHWSSTNDAERPWRARVGEALWVLRVNDFPAEPMYSLLIDGRKAADFDDWPAAWKRPGA